MTPTEACAAFRELQQLVGGEAHVSVSLNTDNWAFRRGAIHVMLYPSGLCHDLGHISIDADTFADALEAIKAAWSEYEGRHRAQRIRKMALEIIRITAEQGACSDAALRADNFTDEEVSRYGEDAIADANEIASNGPFSITKLAGANAA